MTEITMIALSKLIESEDNVRKTDRRGGIGELAASIRSHGLIQSVVVHATETGRFAVVAGGRRLRALRLLAKAGDIEKNTLIPCRLISEENAAELSLAENIVRLDMPVADEIEAFAQAVESGDGPEAIAARFGVTSQHVARRLKLARVSPKLIAALRKDEIDLDQLAALALTDDHARQEAAFFDAPEWARTSERLRAHITQEHLPDTDKLVRFVSVEAYRAEGGVTMKDLFAEEREDPTVWLTDRDLLMRLAEDKLQPIAEKVRGEGWAWVEIALDQIGWQRFPARVREKRRPLSKRAQAKLERLYAKLDETQDAVEIEKIEASIDTLAPTSWCKDETKLAGAIVSLTHEGAVKVERGLVRDDDMKALKALRRKAEHAPEEGDSDGESGAPPPPTARLSAKLTEELQAHKTLALRAELAGKPNAALCILVYTLAEHFVGGCVVSPLNIGIEAEDVARSITRSESNAPAAYQKIATAWRDRLPVERKDLWRYVADAEQQTLLEMLAVMIAPGLDLGIDARASDVATQITIGDLFAEAIGLDMSRWWSASADSYFNHVKRDVILDAMRELKPSLDQSKFEKAPKAELVARAKRMFKGVAWLPGPLRIQSVSTQAPADTIAAE